jgi:hypothetical protein
MQLHSGVFLAVEDLVSPGSTPLWTQAKSPVTFMLFMELEVSTVCFE